MAPLGLPLRCLSIGRSAPAEVREALIFASTDVQEALRARTIRRLVILSTCHRVELYAEMDGSAAEAREQLIDWLAAVRPASRDLVAESAAYLEGVPALRHLHRVTAGLESALIGESEIIAQVRAALQDSIAMHAASPALKTAFRSALASAEKARKAVWLRFPRSDIGSVAVDAIVAHAGSVAGRRALVIGAGRVGTLAARALHHAGAALTIVNRGGERAQELAARFKANWAPFERLTDEVARADAIVVATGAPHVILGAAMLAGAAGRDDNQPVVVADTAMPRNADPAIPSLQNVRLVDLDELHARTAAAHVERAAGVPEAEALAESAVAALVARFSASETSRPAPASTTATPKSAPASPTPVRPMKRTLTIGTRGSVLARTQAEQVVALLSAAHPELAIHWRIYGSSGDERPEVPFAELADDAFTDRIERALLDGEIDAAVHSYKDLPQEPVAGLVIAAIPVRADPRESLVARDGATLATLKPGAVIGTSSPRRAAVLKSLRPDCELRPIRGPVDARLRKVLAGEYDAAVFALAGLQRLGLAAHVSEIFDETVFARAAGQGALAVQCRERDHATRSALASIDDVALHALVDAERAADRPAPRVSAPLHGRRVLVTRAAAQAQPLCDALEAVGAVPVHLPLLRIEPVDPGAAAWHHVQGSHWVVFTSSNGVEQAWNMAPSEARAALRAHARIAAIGPATARAATERGMMVQRIAPKHVAESLAAVLGDTSGQRVLWLRGERARDVLPELLHAEGAQVIQLVVYRAVSTALPADARIIARSTDLVTLASPLAVERFVEVAGADFTGPVACIGPITAASAHAHGLRVAAVAETFTTEGLVAALQQMATLGAHAHV